MTSTVLAQVRKAKSMQKRSQRGEVRRLMVTDTADRLAALRQAQSDLQHAGTISDLIIAEGAGPSVEIELAAASE